MKKGEGGVLGVVECGNRKKKKQKKKKKWEERGEKREDGRDERKWGRGMVRGGKKS